VSDPPAVRRGDLGFEEDGLRPGELARRARLSKQTMTELVRRLERDGLVERRADPSDGRASLVYLTSRSRAFEPIVAEILAELDLLARGRLDDEGMDALKTALTELLSLGDLTAERDRRVVAAPG
jgi:DNA-binding MarR family transcriptional regulator